MDDEKGQVKTNLKEIHLSDAFDDDAPKVNAEAVAYEESHAAPDFTGETDAAGVAFDPEIHAVDAEGRPKLTRKRTFALKRGRKGAGAPSEAPAMVAESPQTLRHDVAHYNTGAGFASLLEAVGVAAGGTDFCYAVDEKTGTDERAAMTHAFARFCEARQITDIPPGIALTIAVIGYVAPRLAKPAVQSRFAKVKGWFAEKIAVRRARKLAELTAARGKQG